jgi:hypothetical protein
MDMMLAADGLRRKGPLIPCWGSAFRQRQGATTGGDPKTAGQLS